MKKYYLWATADKGKGKVSLINCFDDVDEIQINNWIFKDVEFTITYEEEIK